MPGTTPVLEVAAPPAMTESRLEEEEEAPHQRGRPVTNRQVSARPPARPPARLPPAVRLTIAVLGV